MNRETWRRLAVVGIFLNCGLIVLGILTQDATCFILGMIGFVFGVLGYKLNE